MEKEKRVVALSLQRERRIGEENHDRGEAPNDVVEDILLRLPLKSNVRFKTVSKQWRSIIESLCFAERHLKSVEQSSIDHGEILLSSCENKYTDEFRTICLELASLRVINLPIPLRQCSRNSESCNGLVCMYDKREASIYVINPTTGWFRQLPQTRFHHLLMQKETNTGIKRLPILGFAKATLCGYKLVWLYNSDKFKLDPTSPNEGFTKCEVFDFRANAWRCLSSTPRYRIFGNQMPVSANGSVYWLTQRYNAETEVIGFDLQTETFRLLPKTPVASSHPRFIVLCILDNRLCVTEKKQPTRFQEIWSLQSSSEDTWVKIYTIDHLSWSSLQCTPVAVCKNKEILLRDHFHDGLLKYDPQTKSFSSFHKEVSFIRAVPYFQSLISLI